MAFNDPPADCNTDEPFIKVTLDDKCRQQQVNERWFHNLDDVPSEAITMSIRQIFKSEEIVCTVSGQRKAKAIWNTIHRPITNMYPSSYLQKHSKTYLMLDQSRVRTFERH